MKTNKMLVTVMVLACLAIVAKAQLATDVKFYFYPTVAPNSDTNSPEFGTFRDNFLTGVKKGGKEFTTSGSRVGTNVNNVTAPEIRGVFDVSDIVVSTITNLWRGQFNWPSPFGGQKGNRAYGTVLMVGQNGKICLERTSYTTSCGSIPLLGTNSSLAGLSYSVSRIGISVGFDGQLFTSDDIVINTGSGTNMVDAIAFIGGRFGALANSQAEIDAVNAAVGSGTWLEWEYTFTALTNTQKGSFTAPLYQAGQIPWVAEYNRIVPIVGPVGVLFSVVGEPGSSAMNLYGSRKSEGPYSLLLTTATEGTTAFWSFTRNLTNDYGFYRLKTNSMPPQIQTVAAHAIIKLQSKQKSPVVSSLSTDAGQD
jgi:hypothetical protein